MFSPAQGLTGRLPREPDGDFVDGLAKVGVIVDGVLQRGWLLRRTQADPPLWTVAFPNNTELPNVDLASYVTFYTWGNRVEAREETLPGVPYKEWRSGRLVQLGEQQGERAAWFAVRFDDGEWKEHVDVGSPNLRFTFEGASRSGARTRQIGEPVTQQLSSSPVGMSFGVFAPQIIHVFGVPMDRKREASCITEENNLDMDPELQTAICSANEDVGPFDQYPTDGQDPDDDQHSSDDRHPVDMTDLAKLECDLREQRCSSSPVECALEQSAFEIQPALASEIPPALEPSASEIPPALETSAFGIQPALELAASENQPALARGELRDTSSSSI
jgi:hypothetical protein